MNIRSSLAAVAVVFAASGASDVEAQTSAAAYREYRAAMREHGLGPLIPATTDFGPGYVYRIVSASGRREVTRTVCLQAFTLPARPSRLSLPKTHTFRDRGLQASLSLSPGAIAENVSAAVTASGARVRTIDLTFGQLDAQEVAERNVFDRAQNRIVRREIDRTCLANLAELPQRRGKFRSPIFVVLRAVSPERFTYTLNADNNAQLNLNAALQNVASGQLGWRWVQKSQQSFELIRDADGPRLNIAADIVAIESVQQLNEVSDDALADIRFRPATEREWESLALPHN